ncbi:MAG TPA: MFS transporter [Anaerolineae bacterium]|nr:MFS transporter [Anaerolineae bacterium]HOQ97362.1 MFS transporter [Anaerolineae bacterium]HPL27545.1 MFS transporter [Anaerolineae bacterium]
MSQNNSTARKSLLAGGAAITFVVLLGVVSLLADMTYEGGRSLHGQFLQILGSSATAVAVAAGAGEFLGYGIRFFSGYVADRSRRYWAITIIGYAINMLAIPAMALAGQWQLAIALLFLERIGKGIRNPARDAMLSYATSQMGRGFGFGLHEALDQIGAITGPLLVAGALALQIGGRVDVASYHNAYALLLAPALLALAVLLAARFLFPRPSELESKTPRIGTQGLSRQYGLYLVAVACFAAGFADFALMAYHLKAVALVGDQWIPVCYALAMAVDAVAALVLGKLYDTLGFRVLLGVFVLAAFFAPLVFLGSLPLALAGLALWGIGMGAQESIMRAVVSDLVPRDRRASGFGLFHTGYGIAWFLGSALMGVLYDEARIYLVIFSIVIQLLAIPALLAAHRAQAREAPAAE